jgi:hypothetical protein
MVQKHRISTNIGKDQKVTVELKQDYDFLEILSLKFTQQEAYTSICADYGVVCGRITANNGLGIPNARVSIFVPLSDEDSEDPVIKALYPYTSISDRNDNNYRYNLLPERKQHGGHEPTGTFPDQRDVLTREEVLEVYEKYYKYTVKTNTAGDFMIWGVPPGEQTIHVDLDLSDISCFSLRPDDFIRKGSGLDDFKSSYEFKSSDDIDSLPQIVTFDKIIQVYPFWGNADICELGISRVDFDLSEKGIKIEPMAYFIGSIYTDSDGNQVSKGCTPGNLEGGKCSLTTGEATIEAIRFKNARDTQNRPILEEYTVKEDVNEDGSFVLPLPMNMEYLYTNEYGENEITNDPNKGVPTSSCYRFRITMKNTKSNGNDSMGSYLVPNIREYIGENTDLSYNFSLNWEDYPTGSTTSDVVFYNEEGAYYPKDYFYRLNYNKVYTMSSFMGSYFSGGGLGTHTYLGLKDILPKKEDDCESSIVTPPANWGMMNINFAILLAITINIFERILWQAWVGAIQTLIKPFAWLNDWSIPYVGGRPFSFFDGFVVEPLQRFGTIRLGVSIYPECTSCNNVNGDDITIPEAGVATPSDLYTLVKSGTLYRDVVYTNIIDALNNSDSSTKNKLIIKITPSFPPTPSNASGQITWDTVLINISKYHIKLAGAQFGVQLNTYTITVTGSNSVSYEVVYISNDVYDYENPSNNTSTVAYELFDKTQVPITSSLGGSATLNSETLPTGCNQYMTVYDEEIVGASYCTNTFNVTYDNLKTVTPTLGFSCSGGKVVSGQVIYNTKRNLCTSCITWSGYSEFRNGLFTIIPTADPESESGNWTANFQAIDEYCRRKLVGKLFCEGWINYSFLDNWLSGSLYFFKFGSRVRWDNEAELDLSVYSTSYCEDLVYFKAGSVSNPDKRFYYRSTPYYKSTNQFNQLRLGTLAHPTTIVDLGPRDEFIKEICIDPKMDPNCSVSRNIGPTSYQDYKEMLGLYINYKMDTLGSQGDFYRFVRNEGFNAKLPLKMKGQVLNGDILQLMSMNSEVGIHGFDLQDKRYEVYNPIILDPENYVDYFRADNGSANGPLAINLKLDEEDGYRTRVCINEEGRLTESSQEVPFYYWDKRGTGFGLGVDQSWDYNTVVKQPLQGMVNPTANAYKYSGDTSHPYMLLPMTNEFAGQTIKLNAIAVSRTTTVFDYEHLNTDTNGDLTSTLDGTHQNYNMQEEGFTFLYITGGDGTITGATVGKLYVRKGNASSTSGAGNWATPIDWDNEIDYIIPPTSSNYTGTKQILSTPFLFYFGIKPGKTAIDKFIQRFGPKGAFTSAE